MKTSLEKPFQKIQSGIRNLVTSSQPARVLFDHIPKCAGSSVTRYLYQQYNSDQIFQLDGRRPDVSVESFRSLPEKERHAFRLVVGHLAHQLLGDAHPDCISLTILREPIDRIVSHYFYVRRDTGHYLHRRVIDGNVDLKTYVTSGWTSELRNWYTTHFTGLNFEQAEADPDASVQLAFDNIVNRYDVVGFMDDLESSLASLKSLAQFKETFSNETFNKTNDRPGLSEVDPEVIQLIRANHELDLVLYHKLQTHFQSAQPEM